MLHKLFTKPLSATLSRGNPRDDAGPSAAAPTFSGDDFGPEGQSSAVGIDIKRKL